MSKVLVTENHLGNIADAIRLKNGASTTYRPGDMAAAIEALDTSGIHPTGTKNITQNGTHDVTQYASANVNVQPNLQSKTATQNGTVTPDQGYDGLSSVVVNVSGGGAPFLYTLGTYYGDSSGGTINSLTCALSGAIGVKALLIIMHRGTISVPNMTLVYSTQRSNHAQTISIYEKTMQSASETVVITQNSAARMCAASVYVNAATTLDTPTQQSLDADSQTYKYTIAPANKPRLAVIDNVYAGSDLTSITPPHESLPENLNNTTTTIRMAVFIAKDVKPVVYAAATLVDEPSLTYNRLLLYDIN